MTRLAMTHLAMTRCAGFVLLCSSAQAEALRIGVFTLFRPATVEIQAAGSPLIVRAGGLETALEGGRKATVRASEAGLVCEWEGVAFQAQEVSARGRDGGQADFILRVPGKIERRFHGTLLVRRHGRNLEPIVSMELEWASASAVAAESMPGAGMAALKAQAVATRSYYSAARQRHDRFDFCDTTHCQFLRSAPPPASPFARAVSDTRGLLLTYAGRPFPALFSGACGGHTRALARAGPVESGAYPYFAVPCDACLRARPGRAEGHRLGLCQRGAAAMAARGADFRAILDRYYPGTALEAVR